MNIFMFTFHSNLLSVSLKQNDKIWKGNYMYNLPKTLEKYGRGWFAMVHDLINPWLLVGQRAENPHPKCG
jgi:hypothetical protein